ncbi:MAG TPA: hypothetical protein VMT03_15275 [Polyangia bacterium]|nr:hypothetical protein [Polyangia bacterium]
MRSPWLPIAAVAMLGCSSASSPPHGSPVLLDVYWISGGQRTLVWAAPLADGGGSLAVTVPPAGQQVDFVFDRRLDGSKIEDSVTQNGVTVQVPRATPPIGVSWDGGVDSTPPFTDQVFYNTEPFYGGSTAYVFLRPGTTGFPSSNSVVFTFDKTALTSAYNEPMIGPDQIAVATGPFTATVRALSAGDAGSAVPTSYMVPIAFTNRITPAAVAPFVHASSAGVAVPITVTGDTSDPTVVYATSACAGGWPTAAPITVTIDSQAPDAFGGLLQTAASGTFTAVGATQAGDGGC